ncbi:MAG: YraN family protein [Phycisphaerales bacterium]|nr:YraN family protein [Phycisphaerales bacterium]
MIRNRDRRRIWKRGERAARRWMRIRGWRILGRNVRIGRDELDIVAIPRRGKVLAIVEVKATGGSRSTLHRVDVPKQRRVARAAERLPRGWRRGRRLRFDVACVEVGRWRCRVRLMEAAFDDSRPRIR